MNQSALQHIAVCCPTESLSGQIARWTQSRDDRTVEPLFGLTVAAARRVLGHAAAALIDAADDREHAIDLFSQAVAVLPGRRVAVYTERMHEGLELFVRAQGAWLLLGPLSGEEWEDVFSSLLRQSRREPADPRDSRRHAA